MTKSSKRDITDIAIDFQNAIIDFMAAPENDESQRRFMATSAALNSVIAASAGRSKAANDNRPPAAPVVANRFHFIDPADVPEREWLFARHYIRRYLSVTVGAGGGGKSSHSISEALAMVTGRPLLDPQGPLARPLRVWLINAEDPHDELQRRILAASKHFGVRAEDVADRLFVDSGRDQEFVIIRANGREYETCEPLVESMVAQIIENEIDVVIVDPFVSTHEVPENDNGAIQRVARAWLEVADRGNCAVELVHHVTKGNLEVTADSARGGSALKDKARSLRVINPMTAAEAEKAGVLDEDRSGYFRISSGKANMARADGLGQWRRFVGVSLGNGRKLNPAGDEVGVVDAWRWPDAETISAKREEEQRAVIGELPAGALEILRVRLGASNYRANWQAAMWAGRLIAELTGMDARVDRRKITSILDALIAAGELEEVVATGPDRKPTKLLKPVCGT